MCWKKLRVEKDLDVLEETEVEKDLGVDTDNQLKLTNHCEIKMNTANSALVHNTRIQILWQTYIPLILQDLSPTT
jgi:hypothetical protein